MLKIIDRFTEKELYFIKMINQVLESKIPLDGTISYDGDSVRYEAHVIGGNSIDIFVLRFCVRDDVEEGDKFVHISNLMIPYKYQRQRIATAILLTMSFLANGYLDLYFFITGIVNTEWKESLIKLGGIEDEDGDIEINYDEFSVLVEQKWKGEDLID